MAQSFPLFGRWLSWSLPALVIWLSGCSSEHLPMAPTPPEESPQAVAPVQNRAVSQAVQNPGKFTISISPFRLAKTAGEQKTKSKEKLIRARRGGSIVILNGRTLVTFWVPGGALDEDTRIGMEVIGEGPATSVRFWPPGTYFNEPSILTITFPAEGVDPETLGGYVVTDENGTHPVRSEVKVRGKWITVTIWIPHFSQVSPPDGENSNPPEGSGP